MLRLPLDADGDLPEPREALVVRAEEPVKAVELLEGEVDARAGLAVPIARRQATGGLLEGGQGLRASRWIGTLAEAVGSIGARPFTVPKCSIA